MPKETFFRLQENKRNRLMDAARQEFSKYSLNDSSVSNIIKEAGIPRGSFYQYFEDKEDLYYYYFESIRKDSHRAWEEVIESQDGDLFNAFEIYFERMLEEIINGPNALFFKNLFLNIDFRATKRISPKMGHPDFDEKKHEAFKKHHQMAFEKINTAKLKVKNEREMGILMHQLMGMLFRTISSAYAEERNGEPVNLERVKNDFQLQLDWMRNGAEK